MQHTHVGAWNVTEHPRWTAQRNSAAEIEKKNALKVFPFQIFKTDHFTQRKKELHHFRCSSPYKWNHIVRQGPPVFIIHSHKMFSFHYFLSSCQSSALGNGGRSGSSWSSRIERRRSTTKRAALKRLQSDDDTVVFKNSRHMHYSKPVMPFQTLEPSPTRRASNQSPDRILVVGLQGH